MNCNYNGITFAILDNNTISYYTISYGSYGDRIELSISNNNTIIKNSIIENRFSIEINISEDNNILSNNFLNNKRSAKFYGLPPDLIIYGMIIIGIALEYYLNLYSDLIILKIIEFGYISLILIDILQRNHMK